MTFVRLAHFPGGTAAHSAALRNLIGDVPAPEGRLLFAAGPVAGGWQVVQVWQSREQLDAFNRAVFLPALAALGDRGFPTPPQVVDFSPVDLSVGPG